MPSPELILAGLSEIARRFEYVGVGWHLLVAAAFGAVLSGWRPRERQAAWLMSAPLISVALFAFITDNPFNGTAFSLLGLASFLFGTRMSNEPVRFAPTWQLVSGAMMVVFGLVYPHFVNATSILDYLYRPPTGLLPCPTLSLIVGVGLAFNGLDARGWSLILSIAGLLYGIIGAFRLGVSIDIVLLIGSLLLTGTSVLQLRRPSSDRPSRTARATHA